MSSECSQEPPAKKLKMTSTEELNPEDPSVPNPSEPAELEVKVAPSSTDAPDDGAPEPPSETWKIKGFPSYFKSGHVTHTMQVLELDVLDVFKKRPPSDSAYVRFKSVAAKLAAESIINAHTQKKIKRLHCIETPNRAQYDHECAKQLRKQRRRENAKAKDVDSGNMEKPDAKARRARRQRVEPTSIHEVVTPLWQTPYAAQLERKRKSMDKAMGRLRRSLTDKRKMNLSFLKWLPRDASGAVLTGARQLKQLCPVIGIMASPATSAYRNKVSLTIGHNKRDERLVVGFQMGRFENGLIRTFIKCVIHPIC